MKFSRIWAGTLFVLFALAMLRSTGCTVSSNGMTLPNSYYHKGRPQYHSRGAEFPFPNEAAALQEAERNVQHAPGY